MRSSFSRAFGKKSREPSADGKKTKDNDKRRSKSASREHLLPSNGGYQYVQEGYQWAINKRGLKMVNQEGSEYDHGSTNPYQRSISASA